MNMNLFLILSISLASLFGSGCSSLKKKPKPLPPEKRLEILSKAYDEAKEHEFYLHKEIKRIEQAEVDLDARQKVEINRALSRMRPEVKSGEVAPPPQTWTGDSQYRDLKGILETRHSEFTAKLNRTQNVRKKLGEELEESLYKHKLGLEF